MLVGNVQIGTDGATAGADARPKEVVLMGLLTPWVMARPIDR